MVERGEKFLTNPDYSRIPKSADVVIIGGGMAGPGAAWALQRQDPRLNIVLLEKKEQLASGSSISSLENFRTCWPNSGLASMMQRSIDIFLHADDYLGVGASAALGVQQRGYLYCGFNQKQSEQLVAEVEHYHGMGLSHIEYLDTASVANRYPWLDGSVVAAMFDPKAGWLDSNNLAYLYAKQTGDSTQFLLGIEESAIIVESDRVIGVKTPKGTIATPNVIIAAGASSREVGQTAGIQIPVVVRPRQSFTTDFRHRQFPSDAPFLIGSAPYPYVRPSGKNGTIFGWEYQWRNKNTKERDNGQSADYLDQPVIPPSLLTDLRHPEITLMLLARQFGHGDGNGFSHPDYLKHPKPNTGYYVYRAPDTTYRIDQNGNKQFYNSERPIIDAYPGIDGLFLSVAHVGHGVMDSASSGEIVASYVLGQRLPDPIFTQFQLNVPYAEYDAGGL